MIMTQELEIALGYADSPESVGPELGLGYVFTAERPA
jgi:hypothetical protein